MRTVLLLFLTLCLTVVSMIIFGSFNLMYLALYISAFIAFVHGMFVLRDVFVDRQNYLEEGKRVWQWWWQKDGPMQPVLRCLGSIAAYIGCGILTLGTTGPLRYDSVSAFLGYCMGFPLLFLAIMMLFDVVTRVYGHRKN